MKQKEGDYWQCDLIRNRCPALRKKLSEAVIANGWVNKPKSLETRERMAAAKRGVPKTLEHRKAMSLAHKGKTYKKTTT